MQGVALPSHLISLIHHVELNRAGWLDAATRRFVLMALWRRGTPSTPAAIADFLRTELSLSLDSSEVQRHLDSLCASSAAVRLGGAQQFKLSEQSLQELAGDLEIAEKIQEDVRRRFLGLVQARCPLLDASATWDRFTRDLLLPLVRESGARIYQFVSGGIPPTQSRTFRDFLQTCPADVRADLEQAILEFLDPAVPSVRAYILRHVNAFFLLEARALPSSAVAALTALSRSPAPFTLLADTNFLLSVLDLHDNPGNEAALSLLHLAKTLENTVSLHFYVAPITLDETRRVLAANLDDLRDLRITPNLADAIKRGQVSGILLKFVQRCQQLRRPLNAEDYFRPYVTNPLEIFRAKGIELYNEQMDSYRKSQAVIDDVVVQQDFERRQHATNAKSYEQLMHDVTLWHFVKARRPARVESPAEATYWIVTIDFRLLGFDAYKRRETSSEIPVCIHPAALVQLLQFWVPRTPEFEEAIVASIKYPFFYYGFDAAAERTTIRIIEVVSRYENLEDLPSESVSRILVNEALRQRIAAEPEIAKQVELVRDALLEDGVRAREELTQTRARAGELESALNTAGETIASLRRRVSEGEKELAATQARLDDRQRRSEMLEKRIVDLEELTRRRDLGERLRGVRRGFVLRWVIVPSGVVLGMGAGLWMLLVRLTQQRLFGPWMFWSLNVLAWSTYMGFWAWLASRAGTRIEGVREWDSFKRFEKLRAWLYWTLGTVLLGALGNAVWRWIEQTVTP